MKNKEYLREEEEMYVFEDKEKKEYDKNARKECRGGKGGGKRGEVYQS